MKGIWQYRHMIRKLTVTDLKIKYKNSALGFVWALLEPLLLFIVLYFVFTNLMKLQVEHYQLYLFMGIICWNFFDRATNMGLNSMIGHAEMIKKLYFPREVLVISSCLTALVMAFFEFVVFMIFMIFSNAVFSPTMFLAPLILILEFILALGFALSLSVLNTIYRDLQYIWRVILQAFFFLTPILFPVTIFPEEYRKIIMLNPMARVIDMMRSTVIYETLPSLPSMLYLATFSVGMLVIGMFIFKKYEWRLAEEV